MISKISFMQIFSLFDPDAIEPFLKAACLQIHDNFHANLKENVFKSKIF
jgi:hypothetical protein